MIVALAGRRIDAPHVTEVRFPPTRVANVKTEIRRLLQEGHATAFVGSAACGADLIGLDAAASLALRLRIVLPFAPDEFRKTSVVDRPGDWGTLYDRVIERVRSAGDLVVLEQASGDDAYRATNGAILDEALSLAEQDKRRVVAMIVWDGKSRGKDDITEQFRGEAIARGLRVVEVSTV